MKKFIFTIAIALMLTFVLAPSRSSALVIEPIAVSGKIKSFTESAYIVQLKDGRRVELPRRAGDKLKVGQDYTAYLTNEEWQKTHAR